QRRSLRTVSNGHTTEYPEWLTCVRPVIPILSDRQATRRRPPNEPAKNRQMKLTVTPIGDRQPLSLLQIHHQLSDIYRMVWAGHPLRIFYQDEGTEGYRVGVHG